MAPPKILNLTEITFIRLWSKTSGSVAQRARAVADVLGCSDRTILREAERLGLQLKGTNTKKEQPTCECGAPRSPNALRCRSCRFKADRGQLQ